MGPATMGKWSLGEGLAQVNPLIRQQPVRARFASSTAAKSNSGVAHRCGGGLRRDGEEGSTALAIRVCVRGWFAVRMHRLSWRWTRKSGKLLS